MKFVFLLALFVVVVFSRSQEEDVRLFADFKATFNRQYQTEEAQRLKCFQQNLNTIDALNALGNEVHAVNRFADMCPEEFKTYHNLRVAEKKSYNYAPIFSAEEVKRAEAEDIDWRTKGAVGRVKDQGQCGSCWAFSSTGNMEGQWFLSNGTMVLLSEEELVQCSKGGNLGCRGGLMDTAFEWVASNGGIDSEADYPYTSGTGVTGTCKKDKEKNFVAHFATHVDIAKNEGQMLTWLTANGPLAVAVDAQAHWQTYHSGILKTCKGKQLDHGVLAVGYSATGGTPYWIVKNSWGQSWGEMGYIRLQYGTNQCGINMAVSSARVKA